MRAGPVLAIAVLALVSVIWSGKSGAAEATSGARTISIGTPAEDVEREFGRPRSIRNLAYGDRQALYEFELSIVYDKNNRIKSIITRKLPSPSPSSRWDDDRPRYQEKRRSKSPDYDGSEAEDHSIHE